MMSIMGQILFWLVVWFLVSIPLAMIVGHVLRSARRAQTRQYDAPNVNRQKRRQHPIAVADSRADLRRAKNAEWSPRAKPNPPRHAT